LPPPPLGAELLAALERVPREAFVIPGRRVVSHGPDGEAYESPLLPPPLAALMLLLAAIRAREGARVVVGGEPTGYAAAVLATAGCHVACLVDDPADVEPLVRTLEAQGLARVRVAPSGAVAELREGAVDAIALATPREDIPPALLSALAVGGVLAFPLGRGQRQQRLLVVERREGGLGQHQAGTIDLRGRLGELLIDLGVCRRDAIEEALRAAREHGRRLGAELATVGIDELEIHRALALQHGLPFVQFESLGESLDGALVHAMPRAFLERHHALPIARIGDRVRVATSEPGTDLADFGKVLHVSHLDPCVVTPTDFRRLLSLVDLGLDAAPRARGGTTGGADLLASRDEVASAHAIALFEALLLDAIGERASDIHLERYGDDVRVRLRVDGDLHDRVRPVLSTDDLRQVVNVVKVAAELDIAEQRLPQGGRIRRRAGGQTFDLRVQTQPSLWGEHVTIRLLPQEVRPLRIEDLGFPSPLAREYQRLLHSPSGLVLVVGPTGSGKSTTLYAGLQILAHDATRKVISIEDPIEYAVPGVQQTHVRPELGFGFAQAMRAFVREDPDVVLVGEIRDGETALEGLRASQTGHLVLSTLHCNDATDAVQRLIDLGQHPNSIASELRAVMGQRLAKRVCEGCRVPAVPEPALLAEVFPDGAPSDFACFEGRGCPRCAGRGVRGRVAVIEYLRTGAEVRRGISRQLSVDELRRVALGAGLVTMRQSALELVRAGMIPFSELRWVLSVERLAPERASAWE
jgi:type IV pilus assembly protein PilB